MSRRISINSGESLSEWSDRVCKHELANAVHDIANGADIDNILEEFSKKVMSKLLHPIIIAIKDSAIVSTNIKK